VLIIGIEEIEFQNINQVTFRWLIVLFNHCQGAGISLLSNLLRNSAFIFDFLKLSPLSTFYNHISSSYSSSGSKPISLLRLLSIQSSLPRSSKDLYGRMCLGFFLSFFACDLASHAYTYISPIHLIYK
jgi:hypothetical protein